MSNTSSTDLALDASGALEILLENRFAATGRGLHEKLSSVEHQLDDITIRRIRYIASVRNSVVHRRIDIPNPERFSKLTSESIAKLSNGEFLTPNEVINEYKNEKIETEDKERTPSKKVKTYFDSTKHNYISLWLLLHDEDPDKNTSDQWIDHEVIKIYGLIVELIFVYCTAVTLGKIGYGMFSDSTYAGICFALGGIYIGLKNAPNARLVIIVLAVIMSAATALSFLTSLLSVNNSFIWISRTILKYMGMYLDYVTHFK